MSNNIDYVYSPEHDFYIPRLTPPESPGKYHATSHGAHYIPSKAD